MTSKYERGQTVVITPVEGQPSSTRDSALEKYSGKSGQITDYYWISTGRGTAFYIYTVRIEAETKDVVLHEDEIQTHLG